MDIQEAIRKREEAEARIAQAAAEKQQAEQEAARIAQDNAAKNIAREQEIKDAAALLKENKIQPIYMAGKTPPNSIGGGYNSEQIEQAKQLRQSAIQPPQQLNQPAEQVASEQAPQAAQSPAAPKQDAPPAPRGLDFGYGLSRQGLELEGKGMLEAARIEEDTLKQKALEQQAYANELKARKEKEDAELNDLQAKKLELEKEYSDTKLQNPDLWGNASTGKKIFLALGALFSSASPASAQSFRDGIKNAIDRDIDLQKTRLAQKKQSADMAGGVYQQAVQRFKDKDLAESVYRETVLKAMESEAQSRLATTKDPIIQGKIKQGLGTLQKLRDEQIANTNLKMQEQALKQTPNTVNYAGFSGVAPSAKAAEEISKEIAETKTIADEIDRVIKLTSTGAINKMSPQQRGDLESSLMLLKANLASVKGIPVSDKSMKVLDKIIQDPNQVISIRTSEQAALEAVKNSLKRSLENKAQAMGLETPETLKRKNYESRGLTQKRNFFEE